MISYYTYINDTNFSLASCHIVWDIICIGWLRKDVTASTWDLWLTISIVIHSDCWGPGPPHHCDRHGSDSLIAIWDVLQRTSVDDICMHWHHINWKSIPIYTINHRFPFQCGHIHIPLVSYTNDIPCNMIRW